jgi:hypothetical protein
MLLAAISAERRIFIGTVYAKRRIFCLMTLLFIEQLAEFVALAAVGRRRYFPGRPH